MRGRGLADTGDQQVDIHAWNLPSLTIVAPNDTNFTLNVAAIEQDSSGTQSATTRGTEAVTVNPLAPTVTPVAVTGGLGLAIPLILGITVNRESGPNGDAGGTNSLHSVTISDLPNGATLSNSNGDTLSISGGSITFDATQLADGVLNGLAITPTGDAKFTLSVAASEQDAEGNLSSLTMATENVTIAAPTWAGNTLVEYYYFPSLATTYYTSPTFIAPASNIEGNPDHGGVFSLSVTDDTIVASKFTFQGIWNAASFNGFEVVDLSGNPEISGVTIDASSNMAGLTSKDILFDSNAVWVNWEGLGFTTSTVVKLDITFDPPLDPSQVIIAQALDGTSSPAINTANLPVADGTVLALAGTIDNTGVIALDGASAVTAIEISGSVTLQGGGQIELSESNQNYIFGDGTLINVDNTISGGGDIGNGSLGFQNAGVVEAQGPYALIIDTGTNPFVNTGTIETNGGSLIIDGPVTGAGHAVIAGGTLEFAGASDNAVTFSGNEVGVLALDHSQEFTGHIAGFSVADQIDLADVTFSAATSIDYAADTSNTGGVLTVSDGTDTSNLTLTGNYTGSSFAISNDGHGGTLITDTASPGTSADTAIDPSGADTAGTIAFTDSDSSNSQTASFTPDGADYVGSFSLTPVSVGDGNGSVGWEFSLGNGQTDLGTAETVTQSYDVSFTDPQNPAADMSQTVSVSIGGPGNDNFVFAPGIGTDTITNFNLSQDTLELDHFANVQTAQELQALITTNVHGDAVINLGHNDSITLAGVSAPQLQQIIQAGHVLLH